MLHLRPDMASLITGSCNFPTIIYENHPTLIRELAEKMKSHGIKPEIEIFDLAMLYNAAKLVADGLLKAPVHVQFVLGIPGALPADREVLEFELQQLERMLPGATWTAPVPVSAVTNRPLMIFEVRGRNGCEASESLSAVPFRRFTSRFNSSPVFR